jgi:hypothetical protein
MWASTALAGASFVPPAYLAGVGGTTARVSEETRAWARILRAGTALALGLPLGRLGGRGRGLGAGSGDALAVGVGVPPQPQPPTGSDASVSARPSAARAMSWVSRSYDGAPERRGQREHDDDDRAGPDAGALGGVGLGCGRLQISQLHREHIRLTGDHTRDFPDTPPRASV